MSRATTNHSSVDSRTWRILAWLGVALQVVALVAVLLMQRWNGAWIIGGFLALSVAFLLAEERIPSLIDFLVIVAAMINAAGWSWNLFNQFIWYDEVVHFFSAFAVVAALGYLLWSQGIRRDEFSTTSLILRFGALGLGLGIAWELIEMMFLNLSLIDTLIDLLMDTLGAALAGPFTAWVARQQRQTSA